MPGGRLCNVAGMKARRNRYELLGFGLLVLGLALLLVFWPVGIALLVLAVVCLVGSVRGWRFPGEPPPPGSARGAVAQGAPLRRARSANGRWTSSSRR